MGLGRRQVGLGTVRTPGPHVSCKSSKPLVNKVTHRGRAFALNLLLARLAILNVLNGCNGSLVHNCLGLAVLSAFLAAGTKLI